MKTVPSQPYAAPAPQALWRSIYLFNLYRLALGSLFVLLASMFGDALSLGSSDLSLFFRTSVIYVVLALASLVAIKLRRPYFNWQLAFQVGTDIVCVTLWSHASGGIQSGMGMLLLVSLVAAGMISRGRITLLFAALAAIATLLQHSYAVLVQDAVVAQYAQAGLLSTAYFAVAWLAHTLAKYAIASEKLAAQRGVDLANMAEASRLVIQDMPDGVLVVDEMGTIRQHNPSVARLLGYAFPDSGNVTLQESVPFLAERFAAWRQQRERSSDSNSISKVKQGGDERATKTVPSVRPGVSEEANAVSPMKWNWNEVLSFPPTHHQARVRFLPLQRDGFWGAVVFVEDMQRVQAQAQQIKLAALGRLTANIAHEVRNPLSAISYAAELLREDKHDPAQERLLQIILDNAARLNRIVLDVLQLNRRDRMQREECNLTEKLPLFIDGFHHAEGVSREVFSIEASVACPVHFDRGHLEQVLWNLCRNAVRYCQKRAGSVQLHAWRQDDGQTVLEICNDGPAVAAEAIQQLFEPFFTTSVGGTGLGLYIARELCEANGAVLEYRQRAQGGACFRIEFGGRDEC